MMHPIKKIKKFFYRLDNIISYLPVLWKDRQWDHYYLCKLWAHKLNKMRKYYREDSLAKDSAKVERQLMIAENLLKRIGKDEYLDRALDEHYKRWGEPSFRFEDCTPNVVRCPQCNMRIYPPANEETDLCELFVDHELARTGKEKALEQFEMNQINKHSDYMKKQDLEYFCKILKKHLFEWWD